MRGGFLRLAKKIRKKTLGYYIGNGLIIGGLLLLLSIYLPIIKLFLPNQNTQVISDSNFSISIPKINAYAPIIEDVDAFNQTEYRKALKQGVAQAKGNPNFFFAHSSDSPWNLTSYNVVFFRLGELKAEDEIILKKDGQEIKYRVTEKKVVWPSEVEYLKVGIDKEIILQTCTPIGTSLKRLLVFAKISE